MRRPLAFLAVFLIASAASATFDAYELSPEGDPESQAYSQLRRLLTPLELAISPSEATWALMPDPSKRPSYEAGRSAAIAALTGPAPDFTVAVSHVEHLRAEVLAPAIRAYLQTSEAAARAGGPLTPFEAAALESYIRLWNPDVRARDAPAVAPQLGRALLRTAARRYVDAVPSGRIDFAVMRGIAQTDVRGALTGDAAIVARLNASAGIGPAAAALSMEEGAAGAALRAAMPDPAFTALERTILATVLTPAALTEIVAGTWPAERIHEEAQDAANLSVADQNDDEIRNAVAGKTIYRPGALPALVAAMPRADMSRYVCADMDRAMAAAPPGDGTALGQAQDAAHAGHAAMGAQSNEGASADAQVEQPIAVDTRALPGVADYCRQTASLRTSASGGPGLPAAPVQPGGIGREVPSISGTASAPGDGRAGSGSGGALSPVRSLLGALIGGGGGLGLALAIGATGPAGVLIVLGGALLGLGISSLFGRR